MADTPPPPPSSETPEERPRYTSDLAIQNTPNAERYVLEADAMRRRQLRSALLHGTGRNWRERRRAWPAVVAGFIVVAVILAGLSVAEAFQVSQRNQKEREKQQEQSTEQTESPPSAPGSGDGSPTGQPPTSGQPPVSPTE